MEGSAGLGAREALPEPTAPAALLPQGGAVSGVSGFPKERTGGAGPSQTHSGRAGTAVSELSKGS